MEAHNTISVTLVEAWLQSRYVSVDDRDVRNFVGELPGAS